MRKIVYGAIPERNIEMKNIFLMTMIVFTGVFTASAETTDEAGYIFARKAFKDGAHARLFVVTGDERGYFFMVGLCHVSGLCLGAGNQFFGSAE